MYNIKNSKELAKLINYTNLNNMITDSEMVEFLEKAKEFLKDNYNETVKVFKEYYCDISEFVNHDETYARVTFIPDDLDSDNETTEFRIGKIYN